MDDRRNDSEEHFAALVDRVHRRAGRSVAFDDWRQLARLYRMHSSALARSQTQGHDPDRVRYLNSLCLRAYTLLYAAPQRRTHRGGFLFADLPATFARSWPLQVFVASLMLAMAVVGGALANGAPRGHSALIPSAMYPPESLERLATSAEARESFLSRDRVSVLDKSLFSTYLFVHNTQVGLLGFALGILLGIPTLLLVVYNGLLIGAFASLFVGTGQASTFWAWLIPHAIPELLAIVLCSTGGLLVGRAVLAPGRAGRRASIVEAARMALHLVLASVPLFVVAALVESFVRQSVLSTEGCFAFSVLTLGCLGGYALAVSRASRARRGEADLSFLDTGLTAGPPNESRDSAPAPVR